MKKIKIFTILLGSLFLFTGCTNSNVEGTLEEIMSDLNAYVYEGVADDQKPMLDNFNVLEVAPDNIEYYIGTTEIKYEEIYASEPMMSSIAYSVVLVRMKEGADIEFAKKEILDNVNPAKWLCVEVPKEDVIVKNRGNLIILIMVENSEFREKLEKGFNEL